uniref:Uncharacterized protein n=1 Tax=Picea glauca TaxID=3330 RepID=A0A117NFK5_PICGL|nr:hypothetical protein ABT39_MTgene2675 [Picea glauca]
MQLISLRYCSLRSNRFPELAKLKQSVLNLPSLYLELELDLELAS